jgi:hypothetical protein
MSQKQNDYQDPNNVEQIKNHIKTLQTLGEVKNYVQEIFPNWFVTIIDDYSDDYQHLKHNWQEVCNKIGCKKTSILIVDELSHEPNYSLILFLAELFTRSGFAVRRKSEFFPCEICGKALPSKYIWEIMKSNNFPIPENYLHKCSTC